MASTVQGGDASQCESATGWRSGDRIDRYELVEEIGSGAMGVVWSARDIDLGREVALKLIRSGGYSFLELRGRLLAEARAMARAPHPNVVAVHDVGTNDGGLFIAMERLEGGTLSTWLESAPRSIPEILEKFIAAGRGLAEVHRTGMVHRDFKPENVLLGRDGVARVADFGLAVSAGDDANRASGRAAARAATQSGELVGTLVFMAPEQLLGEQATARSDQFGFCVALYQALCGQMPFGLPSGETHAAILLSAIEEGRIAPPLADRKVPPFLLALLLRGLAYDPADRWPTMYALLAALARCGGRVENRQGAKVAKGRQRATCLSSVRRRLPALNLKGSGQKDLTLQA